MAKLSKDLTQASKPVGATVRGTTPGQIKAVPGIGPYRGERAVKGFAEPIQSRRRFDEYATMDPEERRAVPKSVFPGSILERIVYRRCLVLYGPPGPSSWDIQQAEIVRAGAFGGVKIDFVFWTFPPLALEVQGSYWHGANAAYGDAARAFQLIGSGFRYAEIWEEDILSPRTDQDVDRRLQELVSGKLAPFQERWVTQPERIEGILQFRENFKEKTRF